MSCYKFISAQSPTTAGGGQEETGGGEISSLSFYTQSFQDPASSPLAWVANSGKVPTDIKARFEVYENGRRLEYPDEFTVDTSPTNSTNINLVYGVIPNGYYAVKATFIDNG